MKRNERDKAVVLRQAGMSMNEIARALDVSKASVSMWVRDVVLSAEKRSELNARGFSINAIEKRRIKRIGNTRAKRRVIMDEAKEKIKTLSSHELFLVGVALYWGEGGKTERGMARISNSDPDLIRIMMRFFKEICEVPRTKFRGHVHTFSHLNAHKAEQHWSEVSGIPRKQFYKTYSKPSRAGQNKMDSLPHGTFQIYVCDTNLFYQIKGWIERLAELGK